MNQITCTALIAVLIAVPATVNADTSDVVPDGVDACRILLVGKTGFVSSGSLQKKAYAEATEFCAAKALIVETIETNSQQARPLGGYPQAMLRFRCVTRAPDSASLPRIP